MIIYNYPGNFWRQELIFSDYPVEPCSMGCCTDMYIVKTPLKRPYLILYWEYLEG